MALQREEEEAAEQSNWHRLASELPTAKSLPNGAIDSSPDGAVAAAAKVEGRVFFFFFFLPLSALPVYHTDKTVKY
jgi:hypothetical protein